jgi:hypothetical protein
MYQLFHYVTELELLIKSNDLILVDMNQNTIFFRIYTFLEFSYYFICN